MLKLILLAELDNGKIHQLMLSDEALIIIENNLPNFFKDKKIKIHAEPIETIELKK